MVTNSLVRRATQTASESAMAGLRAATWPVHQRLERRLDVKERFTHIDSYRAHLGKMWGFHATLEQQLGQDGLEETLPDYASRRKLPLLTQDLRALASHPEFERQLDRCPTILTSRNQAAALGCAYVLEGATLGGRALLPLVQERLGLTARSGASYLASYGDDVGSMWRTFSTAVEEWCCNSERLANATEAAVATFEALEAWLCGAPS